MGNIDQKRNNLKHCLGAFLFVLTLLVSFSAGAEPFIIESVDGSWLPTSIVQSWASKNGGVLVKVAEGISLNDLKTELIAKLPDLNVEISGKDLFFPGITEKSLFEALKKIDLDIIVAVKKKTQPQNERSEIFVRKSIDPSKDEMVKAVVESVSFDEKHEKITISIKIKSRPKTGAFAKLYGSYRIEHTYKNDQDGMIDSSDKNNISFISLIFLKKNSEIEFVPEKVDSRLLTITPDFRIINK